MRRLFDGTASKVPGLLTSMQFNKEFVQLSGTEVSIKMLLALRLGLSKQESIFLYINFKNIFCGSYWSSLERQAGRRHGSLAR